MKYELNLTEDAEEAIKELKPILGVDSTDEVLSLCLGFVYQLMALAAENEQVHQFVVMLAEKFKAEYDERPGAN